VRRASIEDYAQRTMRTVANWTSMNSKHGGRELIAQADVYRNLSSSLAHDDD
jgi:hypothetical protein